MHLESWVESVVGLIRGQLVEQVFEVGVVGLESIVSISLLLLVHACLREIIVLITILIHLKSLIESEICL